MSSASQRAGSCDIVPLLVGNAISAAAQPVSIATPLWRRALLWTGARPALIFSLWALWLALPYFALGQRSYVRIHDNADSFLSVWVGMPWSLGHHQLGFWAPQWNTGADRIAEQNIPLYFVPFLLLPAWLAYAAVMFAQRFVAGYFLFRLALEDLRVSVWPALFASLAYSAFFQSSLESLKGWTLVDGFGLAAIPWLLWGFSRYPMRQRKFLFLSAAGGFGFALGSSFALAMFSLLAFTWFVFIERRRETRFWLGVEAFVLSWMLASLPGAIAGWMAAPLSQRAAWALNTRGEFLRRALQAVHMLADNAVVLFLVGVAFLLLRSRSKSSSRLGIAAVAAWIPGLCWFAIKQLLGAHFGFLASFQFDRVNQLFPVIILLMAALALGALEAKGWKVALIGGERQRVISIGTAIALPAIGMVMAQSLLANARMFREAVMGSSYQGIYEQPDLEQLRQTPQTEEPFRVATVQDHPAYAWGYGLETADGYWSMTTRRYHEFWGAVIAPLLEHDAERRRYFEDYGLRLYLFSPSGGFAADQPVDFARYYSLEMLSLANVRYVISPRPLSDPNLSLLPSSTRETAREWQTLLPRQRYLPYLLGRYPGEVRYVYENHEVLPRFFFVERVDVSSGPEEELSKLRRANAGELRSIAYIETSDAGPVPENFGTGQVGLVSYSADRIELNTQSSGATFLVISNSYSKFWHAEIDGSRARLLRADYTFQGLQIPAGEHHIALRYLPPYALGR